MDGGKELKSFSRRQSEGEGGREGGREREREGGGGERHK